MSSSGLIYAVIVGAWAAYLVPMWLRRQDELNEARPTERFSTAIRLLSGRAGMERRYAKARADNPDDTSGDDMPEEKPGTSADSVDVRGLAMTATEAGKKAAPKSQPQPQSQPQSQPQPQPQSQSHLQPHARTSTARAKLLARRRRTTTVLFLAFTAGAVAAALGGLAYLWAPAVPGILLSLYIRHLRRQERRRFEQAMDQRRAAEAARRSRERPRPDEAGTATPEPAAPAAAPAPSPRTADRRALVEQTDHAEWVDQQHENGTPDDGWEPVPVPLPTYVTAPVAPRTPGALDMSTPDTWSSARSSAAAASAAPTDGAERKRQTPASSRRSTPLFDQYADPDRPRAANE
ncbi:hypothetical protein NGB36_08155 [Streptomyces sp. RB6PN25]|uniref:Uncharacterized protein n=1 Tax=Streptomyces humicola TaxID=2953240 RepID=A0ABT1PUC2_9ACTN|nr:gephyrin-like molybdotransferase receptor GlpR [Streptomyces humicola]MCQ4080575.1 hypothetical protein [Streptomyces humicola]